MAKNQNLWFHWGGQATAVLENDPSKSESLHSASATTWLSPLIYPTSNGNGNLFEFRNFPDLKTAKAAGWI